MSATKSNVDVTKESAKAPAPAGAAPLVELRDEIDRLFERAFNGWSEFSGTLAGWSPFRLREPQFGRVWPGKLPSTDIREGEMDYAISVELPGVEEKDIDVQLAGDTLTVKGEKKSARSEKKEDFHLSERTYGSFARSFRLPDDADAEKASASFAKGVLSIVLPKRAGAKAKARKLEIMSKA